MAAQGYDVPLTRDGEDIGHWLGEATSPTKAKAAAVAANPGATAGTPKPLGPLVQPEPEDESEE